MRTLVQGYKIWRL